MVPRPVTLGDGRRARRVVVLRDDSMVFLPVVRGLVAGDAERVLLLWLVCLRRMKGVLLFLFFDGVAGIEAEEAAADLHVILGPPCLFCVYCCCLGGLERRPVLERRLVVQKKGAICGRTRLSTRTKSCPPGELSFEMVRGHEIAARNVSLRERDVWVPPQEPEDTRGDNETNSRGATARDPTDTNNILT